MPRTDTRITETKDGQIHSYMTKGQSNPCSCGSKCYHKETDAVGIIYGVCNACHRDVYVFDNE